jgi:hypothetical protein
MNTITKLIASVIAGLILATLITVGLLISAGNAHAGMTSASAHTSTVYVERGGHHGPGKH